MKTRTVSGIVSGYLHLIRHEIINCKSQRQAKQAAEDAKRFLKGFNNPQLMLYGEKQLKAYLNEAGY